MKILNKNRKRGFTIIELIVSLFVISIILSLVGYYVILTLDYYFMTSAKIKLQQDALDIFSKMSLEMSKSNADTVKLAADKSGVMFLSPVAPDGNIAFDENGLLLWQKWVCYGYDSASKKIIRKESLIATPASTPPTAPYGTVADFMAASLPSKDIADGVKSLNVDFSGYEDGYKIKVILEASTRKLEKYEVEGTTEIKVIN